MQEKPSSSEAPVFGPNGAVMNNPAMPEGLRADYERQEEPGLKTSSIRDTFNSPKRLLELLSMSPRHPRTWLGGILYGASLVCGGAMLALGGAESPPWLAPGAFAVLS